MHVLDRLAALAIVLQFFLVLAFAVLFLMGKLTAFAPSSQEVALPTPTVIVTEAPTAAPTATPTAALKPLLRSTTTVTVSPKK